MATVADSSFRGSSWNWRCAVAEAERRWAPFVNDPNRMPMTQTEETHQRAQILLEAERIRDAMDLEDARAEMREYLGVDRSSDERREKAMALANRILDGLT